jgi:hypothetical protein
VRAERPGALAAISVLVLAGYDRRRRGRLVHLAADRLDRRGRACHEHAREQRKERCYPESKPHFWTPPWLGVVSPSADPGEAAQNVLKSPRGRSRPASGSPQNSRPMSRTNRGESTAKVRKLQEAEAGSVSRGWRDN